MGQQQLKKSLTSLDRMLLALVLLVTIVAVGAAGFVFIEGRPALDALYMTLVTISTLGMRPTDGIEISSAEKIWIMFLIVVGIGTATIAITTIVGMVVEGHVRSILGRRQVNRKIASISDHIIVCGYGRMGLLICQRLQKTGKRIVVVDVDDSRTTMAEAQELPYVLGDASDAQVLKSAGIDRASGLVAALDSDAQNVFVTLVARELNKNVFIAARAERGQSEAQLMRAGANKTICPHIIGAQRLANILTRPAVVDFIDFAAEGLSLEAEQYHIAADSKLVNMSLSQANLPQRAGVLVIALKRKGGQTTFNPHADTVLQADDVMVITGQPGSMAKLEQLYS